MHAPTQFEIVNLKATNTEHEERLFGQAKDLAQRATNRQPSTVVPQILLRIQAKQKSGSLYNTYYQSISRVSKAMEELNKPGTLSQNTLIRTDFLTSRMSSWQQHLLRISPFLRNLVREFGGTVYKAAIFSMTVAKHQITETKALTFSSHKR